MIRTVSLLCLLGIFSAKASSSCPTDQLVIYKMIFTTEWSEERFPKQYPQWRPNAQWSKVIGQTHSDSHRIWQMGELSSAGVKLFAETGRTDMLDSEDNYGVFDDFYAQPIKTGVGKTDTLFFLDGNHTMVSLMSKIIPSPDWFVGIDSFNLCSKGKWLDAVTLDLDPLDAGTQNGYTFTSPKWTTDPPTKISRITAHHPNHQANSFFYPQLLKLPRLAYVQFIKTKEYVMREAFQHDESKNIEIVAIDKQIEYDVYPKDEAIFNKVKFVENQDSQNFINSEKPHRNTKKGKGRSKRKPRNCRVGEWSEWGECSKSCGYGNKTRSRKVIKHAARGGKPCPPLHEVNYCRHSRCQAAFSGWDQYSTGNRTSGK